MRKTAIAVVAAGALALTPSVKLVQTVTATAAWRRAWVKSRSAIHGKGPRPANPE